MPMSEDTATVVIAAVLVIVVYGGWFGLVPEKYPAIYWGAPAAATSLLLWLAFT